MQRFKNILVVVDPDNPCDTLVGRAVSLARRNQASLTAVTFSEESLPDMSTLAVTEPADVNINLIEEMPPDVSAQITSEAAEGLEIVNDTQAALSPEMKAPYTVIQEQIAAAESHNFEKTIASIRQAGVQINGKVMSGTPFLEIIREVLRNEHDLVMIAAENEGGLKKMLFGSTTMHLMRKCPCPVWVVKPGQPERYTRILAAVDPTPHDDMQNALNDKIMELSTSLARWERSELLIIHTWTVFGESRLTHRGLPQQKVDKIVHETRDAHKRWLGTLLSKHHLEDLQHQVYMLKGEAGRLIPALAKAQEVDLIVMGTVSRTGIAGLLIGNTAEKVLNQVNCSMLTVKPEGFITPVKLTA
ncbi:MAG: universal stress protein [Chloroflexi bacterium]|nr:universal stress protein [Chloroflexota bacterium]